jgi:hypothetical protein
VNHNRRFLYEMLGSGLELGMVTPEDVLKHITPEILAHHLPVHLKAKLLEASLAAEKMSPGLIVESVGVEPLAEHSPTSALWACMAECARRAIGASDDELSSPRSDSFDDALKPNRPARTTSTRIPARVSALSPRSRVTQTRARINPDDASVDLDAPREPVGEVSSDLPLVVEEEYTGSRQTRQLNAVDEETRPGDITGRKV